MLDCISGYKFFTKFDISMQYNTFELIEPSQELCVIITSIGNYKYKYLPMGYKCAPDKSQQVIEEVLHSVGHCLAILMHNPSLRNTASHPWTKYYRGYKPMVSLSSSLNANGPLRWLTGLETGSHPLVWNPGLFDIDGILQMKKTENLLQICGFLGAVNHYLCMASMRTHTCTSLQQVWNENILLDLVGIVYKMLPKFCNI